MEERWQVNVAEESRLFQLGFDYRHEKYFSWKRRSGELRRTFANAWQSHFVECAEGPSLRLSHSPKKADAEPVPSDFIFDSGEILERHSALIDFLERSGCQDWKVHFRGHSLHRRIESPRSKSREIRFNRFTVHIHFRLKGHSEFMEIGEGNGSGMAFYCDGLMRRIEAVCANQKNRKQVKPDKGMPVLLHSGEGAIFFHEILGHALEADHVLCGQSPFAPADLGKRLMPGFLTVQTDDGRDTFFYGCPFDDEGEAREKVVLIERGVLRHFMADAWHARLLKLAKSGHCRFTDFTSLPQPRMFGLYIMPGPHAFDEMLAGIDRGIFAREFGDGQIDLYSGKFRFFAQETYLIENGSVTTPLGTMIFSGDMRTVLSQITMIGSDFAYDKGVSLCRKNGQVVAVRVGQPTVKIDDLTVEQVHLG